MAAACGPTSSPTPTHLGPPPQLVAFSAGIPTCKNAGDAGAHVTLYWRSNNATSVWIASYSSINAAGDPKTTAHARGPLPPNASLNLPFNCATASNPNEYTIGVYSSGRGSQLKSILVKRNF